MCYSSEASFTAATFLAIVGITTIVRAPTKKYIPLMGIPLIFALQQLFEGFIWRNPQNTFAIYGFIFFAYLFWPAWTLFSLYLVETKRQKTLLFVLPFTAFLILYNLYMLLAEGTQASITNNSIKYDDTFLPLQIYYGLCVLIPFFISTVKRMWIFGVLLLASFIAANLFYTLTFTSNWCFFAAALSVCLLFIADKGKAR